MSVISRTSYRSSTGRYTRRKAQPNFALMIIAFCLGSLVWGNYQITTPPSCGDQISVGFMNIDAGTPAPRACEAGEVPVQQSIGDSLSSRFQTLLPSASAK
jgi:hypothetical protein